MSEATSVTPADPILSDWHRHMLEAESAITPEVIQARGYRTVEDPKELLMPLPEWEDIKLCGREVYVAFDSDAQTNPHVLKALIGLCEFLRLRGANA